MSAEQVNTRIQKWKTILLILCGGAGMLLVTSIVDYPILKAARNQWSGEILLTGWFGVWLILVILPAAQGLYLLVSKNYREAPVKTRLGIGFGYLTCAWVAMVAFLVRTVMLSLPFMFFFIVALAGVILAGLYFLLSRSLPAEEIFP